MARGWLALVVALVGFLLLGARCEVPDARVEFFSASAASVSPGSSVTLSWRAMNTDTCRLQSQVTGGSPDEAEAVSCVGSSVVSPAASTTYRFSALKRDGVSYVWADVVVEVAADWVTLVAPVASLPGSRVEDVRLVSPVAERSVSALAEAGSVSSIGVSRLPDASFLVPRDRVVVVGAVDVVRDVGWTALWPGWFGSVSGSDSSAFSASSEAAAEEIGPLSTAVQMVFSLPGFYDTDLVAARESIGVMRGLPEVLALAAALEEHAAAVDVLNVPAVEAAYVAAVDAAAAALAGRSVGVASASGSVAPSVVERASAYVTGQVELDVDLTQLVLGTGDVSLGWDSRVGPLSRSVTWLGYVYEVDPGAFDDWSSLRVFLNEDPWRADVPLVSSVPVGALMLEPDTVYSYIDVIGILAGYVAGLLPGVGDGDLAFAIPDRDAVYAVHAVTCSPGLANYLWLENHQDDARLLLNWPGGVDSHSLACVTNFVEMALDAASLVLDTTFLAETIAVGAVRGRLEALALDALDGADDPFRISPQAWVRTGTVMLSAIYEEAADRAAKEGLKALLRFAIRQKAKMFDVPGAAASVGKFATRLGGLSAVTPWEGAVIQVGDPWRDSGVSVSLSPSSVTLPTNGTQEFTATVTGTANTSVSWSTTCGSVSGSGSTVTYIAPASDETCEVTATSMADPSRSATAIVTVEAGSALPGVFFDDFDDRDYASSPTWTLLVAGNKDDNPALNYVDVSGQFARFVSTNHGGRGGSVGLLIEVDIAVEADTSVRFDALAAFRDVGDGCGWTCREYPANVLLHLEDELGTMYRVIYGVNYGGAVQDQSGEGWRIITTSVDQGVWARGLTFRVKDAWPDAVRITLVQIHGSGWNFDGGIDNITIFHEDGERPLRYVLSSTPDGQGEMSADDDMDVYLNGTALWEDPSPYAGPRFGPLAFDASPGDVLRVVVTNNYQSTCGWTDVYAIDPKGVPHLVLEGVPYLNTCRIGVMADESFTLP